MYSTRKSTLLWFENIPNYFLLTVNAANLDIQSMFLEASIPAGGTWSMGRIEFQDEFGDNWCRH